MQRKYKFTIAQKDSRLEELVTKANHKILAVWAIECVERVMPYFEEKYPYDNRPRKALDTLQEWINTGVFKMSAIRGASLASHAAARDVGEDSPARSVARAAGQAVATAHVYTHSIGGALYALQAIYRATDENKVENAIAKERDWQYERLVKLTKESVTI
jgi:hypothetical protein